MADRARPRCSGSGSRRSSRVAEEEFADRWSRSYRPSPTGPLAAAYRELGIPGEHLDGEVAARHEFGRRVLGPRPGAVPALAALRADGIRLAVLSVCSEEVPAVWPETELAGLFDVETFSSDCGLMKPEPEIYLRTAEALGVEPADCLFVGDGANDELRGAERVGMTPVLFLPGRPHDAVAGGASMGRSACHVDRGGARAVLITTMNDLPGYAIDEVYGEVFGLTVRSRNVGSTVRRRAEVDRRRRAEGDDEVALGQPARRDRPDDRGGRGEGRERRRRDALRHLGDGRHLDRDLRLRHGRPRAQALRARREAAMLVLGDPAVSAPL